MTSASSSQPTPLARRRALRWLVPAAAAGVVGLLASGVLSADANPNLPPQNAAQLLAAVGDAKVAGFSGTVVERASLGLPELPDLGGASPSTGTLGLLTGSHTVRVWYAGQTKQRVALLDSLGEQDVFRNGRSVWQWNSDDRTASHSLLPADAAGKPDQQLPAITPDQAARQALALIDPSTSVSTDHAAVVAGRAAYVLVLTPKDTRSRISTVRISVDGKTKVPLGVQVYPRGSDHAAIDISFTRFNDKMPSDDNFTWTPPAGVTVKPGTSVPNNGAQRAKQQAEAQAATGASHVKLHGTGWTTVAEVTGVPALSQLGSLGAKSGAGQNAGQNAQALLGALPSVKGSWGSGRLFRSALVTGLFTSDGRVFVGAVDPDVLYQAAAKK